MKKYYSPDLGAEQPTVDPDELEQAKKLAESSPLIYTHEFSTPCAYNGELYQTLTFDFDALNGSDCLAVEKELAAIGISTPVPALNSQYLIRLAAKACTAPMIGSDLFLTMKARDFMKITNKTRNFLLKAEL